MLLCAAALCLHACGAALAPPPLPAPAPVVAEAPPPPPAGPRATVATIDAAHPLVKAGLARAGDLWLRGDAVQAVVAGPDHPGPGGGGGHLVAVGPAGAPEPLRAFAGLVPMADADGLRPVRATLIEVVEHAGPSALVRVQGHPQDDPDLRTTVEYRVDASAPGLQIRVRQENRSAGRHPDAAPSWLVRWGELEPVVPGLGINPSPQRASAEWLAGDGEGLALALGRRGGLWQAAHGPGWSVAAPARIGLDPKATLEDAVRVDVARGDGAQAVATLLEAGGLVFRRWTGVVRDPLGGPVPGASVILADRDGRAVVRARTDGAGRFAVSAPTGDGLTLRAEADGRTPSAAVPVTEAAVALGVGAVGHLQVSLVDERGQPVAGRLTFDGPTLRDAVDVVEPTVSVPVTPGRWTVVAEPAPYRRRAQATLTVAAGGTVPLRLRVPAAFDPAGWRSVDADAPGSRHQHGRACQAHGIIAGVVPGGGGPGGLASHSLALDDRARFAAWPAEVGTTRFTGRAGAMLAEARRARPRAVLALLNPRSPGAGYFERFGFVPGKALPAGGFSLAFDAVVVASPTGDRAQARRDWFDLLWRGVPVAPLGGSGGDPTRRCGTLRTWVGAPGPWRAALQKGPVCVSGGPLAVVEPAPDGQIRATVWAAPRHRPRRIRLWADGQLVGSAAIPEGAEPFIRNFRVPGGIRWVVAEVDDPSAADDEWSRWAMTGALRPPGHP